MAGLTLRGLTKDYAKGVRAVDGVDLTVEDGEFIVLLGPSGCGKSTLLRMIAGLETITDGELIIGDDSVSDVHPRERNIAMVFQNYALYPHMTVRKNLAYPLKLQKWSKSKRNERVEEIARLLELDELLDRRPGALSGGQRQRVAMGRALVREPSVFLMDEPLSNLDARLRLQMRTEITSLQRAVGITTVYVTHDQVEAMTMADRVVILNSGVVQQIGTPAQVFAWPANLFVASFVGSPPMNFLAVECGADSLAIDDWSIPVDPAQADEFRNGCVAGIRPSDIHLGESVDGFSFTGTVTAAEVLGAETLIHVDTDQPAVSVVSGTIVETASRPHIFVSVPGDRSDLLDQQVVLSAAAEGVRLFDAQSGQLLPFEVSDGRLHHRSETAQIAPRKPQLEK